ncbi:MAG: hypothetical protein HY673_01110 [Chloroflexi bacterium]|nr:hypothetical protein [Chloroflexota bacterium]
MIRKKARLQKQQRGLAGSHEVIIFAASEKSVSLSQQLDQLKEARVLADYRLGRQYLTSVGKQSWLDYARDTLALASQVLPAARKLPRY